MSDVEEVTVLSDLLKSETHSGSDDSTLEGSWLSSGSSVDVPSRSESTRELVGVQVPELSTTEAAKMKIPGEASKPRHEFEEHSTSIEVTFDKFEHGPSLGWCVDATNHHQLVIKDMMHQSCAAVVHTQAAAFDRIKSVNGLPGGSTELIVMMQDNARLKIQLLRPKIIDVRVESDRKLGADVEYTEDSLGCIIHEIHSGGLLAMWNSLNPSQLVKPMDRIISVNGKEAPAPQLIAVLSQRCATTMEVLSYQ